MREVNARTFETKVLKSILPVIVVIWGVGWGFCRRLKPQVGALAEESEGQVSFYNLEPGPNLQFLADLDVSGLPTFLFYKDGEVKSSLAGSNILLDEITAETAKLLR